MKGGWELNGRIGQRKEKGRGLDGRVGLRNERGMGTEWKDW